MHNKGHISKKKEWVPTGLRGMGTGPEGNGDCGRRNLMFNEKRGRVLILSDDDHVLHIEAHHSCTALHLRCIKAQINWIEHLQTVCN